AVAPSRSSAGTRSPARRWLCTRVCGEAPLRVASAPRPATHPTGDPMKLEHTLTYDADPVAVFAVLADPDYVEDKCWATGATEAGVEVDPSGADTVIRTVRTLPADVPSYARSFVGDAIEFDLTETWGPADPDGSRDGTIEGSFTGTPMKVRGTMT